MTSTTSIYQALTAGGIDADAITETPDGVVTAVAPDGTYACIGDDGQDETGQQWWTATRYDADGAAEATDSWTTLDAMATAVAAWLA